MSTVIVTVDLGHFKAYRVTWDPVASPKIELIASYDSIEGHGKLGGRLCDIAGRFVGGGGEGEVAKGYGEPHNLETNIRKKLAKLIALDINALIKKEDCGRWYLAAGEKINKDITKKLDPAVKAILNKNISFDLTNTPRSEILSHFE